MSRFMLLTVLSVFIFQNAFSQESTMRGNIAISIFNEQKSPLEGVTIQLLKSKDSSLTKTAITDKSGFAEFINVSEGLYIVKATMVHHVPAFSSPFNIGNEQPSVTLPAITMQAGGNTNLQGVTVTAQKPFIQRLSDRLVVNVENSIISAGSSAMDVLERSPGITIDQNDAISLRGRAGVIIMIDGKITAMSGADLANYLRGLPSNAIESIHIITNPSAKYDAAGNSGIIDIKMKKDQRLGSNGTLTVGYGQGVYPKANAGGTLNYRNKKVNVFGNYTYAYRKNLNHLILNRNFYNNGVFKGSDDKDNYTTAPFNSHSARVGADFFPTKKTIVGFVVNSNFNNFKRTNNNNSVGNNEFNQPYYYFKTLATNDDHTKNIVANINLKHTFDSTGKEITADADYGFFNSNSLSRTFTSFYELNGSQKQPDDILDGDQDGKLTLKTAKIDYVNPLKGGAKFEIGAKTSLVTSDNDAKFFNVINGSSSVDVTKTNQFFYKEYNNAGYFNISKNFKKFNFQLGLRGEQTKVSTHQIVGNVKWDSSYFQLFPSAFFNYNLKDDQTLGISVSRRIDRPGYSSLNPFLFLIDATTYATGNPRLLPQLTWAYELNYTVKNINFTLGYSHSEDPQNTVIAKILEVIPGFQIAPETDSNITVQIPVNFISSDYYGLSVSAPIRLRPWWNMMNNLDVYYNSVKGDIGGTLLTTGAPAANFRTNNNFTLKKGWGAEFIFNYRTGGVYGYSNSRPQWGVAVGAQKTVMKGKGTFRFNVTDIFWTNLPQATITYEGRYVENWKAYRETRVANLNFTYRFGNNKVQASRKRTTASEEERRRAGGN